MRPLAAQQGSVDESSSTGPLIERRALTAPEKNVSPERPRGM
jgi:hypothetical protein